MSAGKRCIATTDAPAGGGRLTPPGLGGTTSPAPLDVLVVGAGIGGLAAALAASPGPACGTAPDLARRVEAKARGTLRRIEPPPPYCDPETGRWVVVVATSTVGDPS